MKVTLKFLEMFCNGLIYFCLKIQFYKCDHSIYESYKYTIQYLNNLFVHKWSQWCFSKVWRCFKGISL